MVKVKVCGITNLKDALKAIESGADAIGFVLYPKSKRYVKAKKVREITSQLPPFITKVGVFVNENPRNVLEILSYAHLDYAQLHGEETPKECEYIGKDRVIKAFRVKDKNIIDAIKNYYNKVKAILLDTYSKKEYGGTGKTFNWEIAQRVKEEFPQLPLILSGGLSEENVLKAIESVKPFAVDVSSGVEKSPGIKDHQKLESFVKIAKCYNEKK